MRDALLRSGYLLELRVESMLREHWGYVEANATYPDRETGTSREFDIFALRALGARANSLDFIWGSLLIECVNNPQPLVVLTKEPLAGFLHHYEIKVSGLPTKVLNSKNGNWERLSEYLGMQDYHHYCKGRIGTQYCSFVKKKTGNNNEWMAMHEGVHYESFRKLCDVTDYFIGEHFKGWTFGDEEEDLNVQFYYPLIIVQGDLVEAYETKRSVGFRSAEHIQFRQSLAMNQKNVDFQIDIIRERYLPKYLEMIDAELEKTARLLRRRHKVVRSNIESIVAEAKNANSAEEVRRIMDFGR
jgi:hypothetical protein